MGTDEESTAQTRVWLSLAALDDAMHHLRQQPLTDLNRPHLDLLCCQLYMAAGLSPEEANLLYGESVDRHAERLKAVLVEVTT